MSPEILSTAQLNELLKAEAGGGEPDETGYSAPILRMVAEAERGRLSRSFVERYCAPGEIVFREGDTGDGMFLIWSGRAAIVKGGLDNPVVLAFRWPGEIFGEMALLDNQPRSATVVALDHLRLLEINRQRFDQLLREAPNISRSIMEILSARLRRMSNERGVGELSEKRLSRQVHDLESEKKRLEELQRLRQETSELIIHDLRNPLGAVSVALKMIDLVLPDEARRQNREILDIAQASCMRMQRLVDSLLEVSRMEEGDTAFVMGTVDLHELIAGLVQRTAILALPEISLSMAVEPDLPPVQADLDKIERVLTNLLDNAMKYSPDGGQVVVEAVEKDGCVQVAVSDSGPGIPADERERIFERFTQIPARRGERRGFGLGLTYCRLAVERHGGRIWVEPGKDGQGSRFVFTLPLAGQNEPDKDVGTGPTT